MTHDPEKTRQFWADAGEETDLWMDWEANKATEAKALASRFVVLGMIPGPSEDLDADLPTFVYVS